MQWLFVGHDEQLCLAARELPCLQKQRLKMVTLAVTSDVRMGFGALTGAALRQRRLGTRSGTAHLDGIAGITKKL